MLNCFSCVRLFAIPWTVALQTPLSMEFSSLEYWSGLSFPSLGDLSNPGIKPWTPTLQADFLQSEPPGKPIIYTKKVNFRFSVLCLRGKESFQQNKILSTNKQRSLIYRFSESVLSVKHFTYILVRKCSFPWSPAALPPITEATLLSSD